MVTALRFHSASSGLGLAPFVAGVICLLVVHIAIVFLLYGSRAFVRSFAVPSEVVFLFPSAPRVHRILFLGSGASDSHIPTVARSLCTDASFVLAKLAPRIQCIRNLTPRARRMERQPSNQLLAAIRYFLR